MPADNALALHDDCEYYISVERQHQQELLLLGLAEALSETSTLTMAKSSLLLGGLVAFGSTTLAASNFPDCSSSGPLGNNSVCDTSLGEMLDHKEQ
jgi:hypothetical protein